MSTLISAGVDSSVIAHRNLLNSWRTPGALITGIIQPIIFVLLLAFVFGGRLGGDSYREFLIGGILAQTLTFNSSFTAVYLAKDLQLGLIDRFRSLPMSRVAVILGRTTADLATSIMSMAVIIVCGLAIGWRIEAGPWRALGAVALLLAFTFSVSWIGAVIALTARSVEVAQSLGLIWLFPVTFISGAFVPLSSLPGLLRAVAEWNPVTAVATAVRQLFGNGLPPGFDMGSSWPLEHAIAYALLSCVAIIVVFAPLAVWQYRRIGR